VRPPAVAAGLERLRATLWRARLVR